MAGTRGRGKRAVTSPEKMMELWRQYLIDCANKTVTKSKINMCGEVQDVTVRAPVTPKIFAFANDYLDISEKTFYETYKNDEKYQSVIARMMDDCHRKTVECFEQDVINPKLSGLLLSRYGYNTAVKQDIESDSTIKVVIDGEVGDYGV